MRNAPQRVDCSSPRQPSDSERRVRICLVCVMPASGWDAPVSFRFLNSTYPHRTWGSTPLLLPAEQNLCTYPPPPVAQPHLGRAARTAHPTDEQSRSHLPEFGLAATSTLLPYGSGSALLRLTSVGAEPKGETCQKKLLKRKEEGKAGELTSCR
jgi:hypothetical protein